MNHIKTIFLLGTVAALLLSCSKEDYRLNSQELDPFVRFNLTVNNAGVPLEYPEISTIFSAATTFKNKSLKRLKVPVTLTATNLKAPVKVQFSTTSTGNTENFSINPSNELLFEGTQLTDTIYVSFDERWAEKQSINLKLESASDPQIHLGNLNTAVVNDVLSITFGKLETTYTFPENRIVLKGEMGETITFKVNFPNGFIPSEIEKLSIFKFSNSFDYSLTHEDFGDNRSSITYRLTLLEDLQNDDVQYQTKIELVPNAAYTAIGSTSLQIIKPQKSLRDVQANPASKFYDLSNAFYQTYGVNWFDKNGTCAWQSFNAFTFPVVVPKEHENAILYSDKGTTNPNDDVYHDAFIVGFNVVTGSSTVNSFGLKRWFSNEASDAASSPGFNIPSALEFFPENGNSKTNGTVQVIAQSITIAAKNVGETKGKSYSIDISGEGTYKEISAGLFEISFELKLTNDALFGGTISSQYKIYNKNNFPTPSPINDSCPQEITL